MRRVAIIGGGIAGLSAAYELARQARNGAQIEAVLFESSSRFGGLIETVREGGFTIECGPDAWVSAKPWARELAIELGLESELTPSNDATRKTHIFLTTPHNPSGALVPMPDGFHLMVPTNLAALDHSPLFTPAAIAAYRAEPARAAELLASIPPGDESVADFTLRHFGPEVLSRVAAPLLSGVFGGDVRKLSVRAVMPAFVQMERQHGSLIIALQVSATNNQQPIFTTLRTGLGTLINRLVANIPTHWLRPHTTVTAIARTPAADSRQPDAETSLRRWTIHTATAARHRATESFDAIFLATPLDATRRLLAPIDPTAAQLLPNESSSAVLVAFAYADATRVPLPPGFGFLVPPFSSQSEESANPREMSSSRPERSEVERPPHLAFAPVTPAATTTRRSLLLACTFADQKFPHRVPPNGRLVRAFFSGAAAERIARCNNDEIAAIARLELARILQANAPRHPDRSGAESRNPRISPLALPAPTPAPVPALTPPLPVLSLVRRWPNSLPQYAVGHPARIAELESRVAALPGLTLLGNALHGVGIPDLIRAARNAARLAAGSSL
jgi:oxygen-dependent protoporphyrinogen oxidase